MTLNRGRSCPYCGAVFSWRSSMVKFAPWIKPKCRCCNKRCKEPAAWSLIQTIMVLLGMVFAWPYTSAFIGLDGLGRKGGALVLAVLPWYFAGNLIAGCFIPLQKLKESAEQAAGGEKFWPKLVHRAEACPKCGHAVCLLSDRITSRPRRIFSCSFCGCKSHTPAYACIVPILSLAFSVWLLGRREKLPLAALIVSLIAYFVTYGCMVLIMPLKEKGDKSDQPAAARRRDR